MAVSFTSTMEHIRMQQDCWNIDRVFQKILEQPHGLRIPRSASLHTDGPYFMVDRSQLVSEVVVAVVHSQKRTESTVAGRCTL